MAHDEKGENGAPIILTFFSQKKKTFELQLLFVAIVIDVHVFYLKLLL